jgi:hypothetical protein
MSGYSRVAMWSYSQVAMGSRSRKDPRAGDLGSLAERRPFPRLHHFESAPFYLQQSLKGQNTQPPLCHNDQDSKSAAVMLRLDDVEQLIRLINQGLVFDRKCRSGPQ